jgi:hypothetical protein
MIFKMLEQTKWGGIMSSVIYRKTTMKQNADLREIVLPK